MQSDQNISHNNFFQTMTLLLKKGIISETFFEHKKKIRRRKIEKQEEA